MSVAVSAVVCAQTYPARPVRIEVGFPPASTVDIVARAIAQKLSEAWGQPVIVENRPGGSGNVAAELVAKSIPDGYTLLMANNSVIISRVSQRKHAYNVETDLKAVSNIASAPHVLIVTPSLPVASVHELIALARARPGQLSYASVGAGSPSHLAAELFKYINRVDVMHVPYKGSSQVLVDVATGDVQMSFSGLPSALPLAQRRRV